MVIYAHSCSSIPTVTPICIHSYTHIYSNINASILKSYILMYTHTHTHKCTDSLARLHSHRHTHCYTGYEYTYSYTYRSRERIHRNVFWCAGAGEMAWRSYTQTLATSCKSNIYVFMCEQQNAIVHRKKELG